jgi:hypothetical protein
LRALSQAENRPNARLSAERRAPFAAFAGNLQQNAIQVLDANYLALLLAAKDQRPSTSENKTSTQGKVVSRRARVKAAFKSASEHGLSGSDTRHSSILYREPSDAISCSPWLPRGPAKFALVAPRPAG